MEILATGGDQNNAYFSYFDAAMVTITSAATIPVAATLPTFYTATGNIAGTISTAGKVIFTRIDGTGSYGYAVGTAATYSILAPNGTYQLTYADSWPGGPFYPNLGAVTINGANTTGPAIAIPTSVNLSGTVSFTDAAPTSVTVFAKDIYAVPPLVSGYAMGTLTATATSGAYSQLKVRPGEPNYMSISYAVNGTSAGTVSYAPAIGNPITVSGDGTFNFTVPGTLAAPASQLITISGTVTDVAGAGVSGATVVATSNYLTSATAPGVSYTSATSAATTASGAYTLQVLPGTDYTLTFTK